MKNWTPPIGYVEKKYNYTYKLTFKLDDRYYYYGVHSTNIDPQYDNYYGSGTNVKKLREKYGKDCFNKEILEFFPSKKDALLAEDALVPTTLLDDEFCLNKIQGGGNFDSSGMKFTDEQKEIISKRFKGRKRTQESIRKMIETRRKRGTDKHSEATKKKLSDIQKSKITITKNDKTKRISKNELEQFLQDGWSIGYSEERNKKVSISKIGEKNPNYGKPVSKETIEKMLETKRKNNTLSHSEETREKLATLNRKKANDTEFRKRLSEACKGVNTWSKGRISMKKNGKVITVKKEDVDKFLNEGWIKGRLTKKEREFYNKNN